MQTLFIADVHLSPRDPKRLRTFLDFLSTDAAQAEALYILGDLFEIWLGDDLLDPFYETVIKGLYKLTQVCKVPCYVIRGNRDFLIGQRFLQMTGLIPLPEVAVIRLYETPTLLLHGDQLCTRDTAYQRWRRLAHCSFLQKLFLWLPPSLRKRLANRIQRISQGKTKAKSMDVMDVTSQAVQKHYKDYRIGRMIHGHTHRPAIHYTAPVVNGPIQERVVLGSWDHHAWVLTVTASSIDLDRGE